MAEARGANLPGRLEPKMAWNESYRRRKLREWRRGRVWGAGPTWRYFLTFPWATMTSEGALREAVRWRSAEGRVEEAEVQGNVEAHDGDAIVLALRAKLC